MTERTPDEILKELTGYLEGLLRIILPFNSAGANTIKTFLQNARRNAQELGEALHNDPNSAKVEARLKELDNEVKTLTKQIVRMAGELATKDETIADLQKQLETKDEPDKEE